MIGLLSVIAFFLGALVIILMWVGIRLVQQNDREFEARGLRDWPKRSHWDE